MKLIYLQLVGAFLLTTFTLNAQVERQDTLLAQKAILDVENPQFVWAMQQNDSKLLLGLLDNYGFELRNGNSIWFVNKVHPAEQLMVKLPAENDVVLYIMEDPSGMRLDTLGLYNPSLGNVLDKKCQIVYQINPSGLVMDGAGRALLQVGKIVNKRLAAFFLLYQYPIEMKKKQFMQEQSSRKNL